MICSVALDDVEYGIFANAEAEADFPVGLTGRETPQKGAFSCGTVRLECTSTGTVMPRRELLTELQRLAFTEPLTDERGMVRYYTLGA
jgi:hypothetical protein